MDTPHLHKISEPSAGSLVTRTLDAVDRAHARGAARLHDARNGVVGVLERGIDRVEQITTTVIERARKSIQRVDTLSANAVNRAQGAIGQTLEKLRLSRTSPEHLTH